MESPALEPEIRRFVKEENLDSHFTYAGYVGEDVKRTEYFRDSDIFIFPTQRDVFGLVLLHAMAEGLPVVASIEGAIPEIVQDGENGFLFPKGDEKELAQHILTLAAGPPLRKRMGAAGRQRYLLNFTPQMYGERMIGAFKFIDSLN